MANLDSTTKICTKCKRDFPATAEFFYRHKRMKDGLSARCKFCHNEDIREYRQEHSDLVKQRRKDRYWSNPEKYRKQTSNYYQEHKAKCLEYIAQWQTNNADKIKQYKQKSALKYREKTKERHRSQWKNNPQFREAHTFRVKRWAKNNPEKISMIRRRRYARHRGADGTYTTEDVKIIYTSQNGRCWWCGEELNGKFEIDHRIPISRGGSNKVGNLCLTCVRCNRSKSDKLPHEWIGRLL